MCGVSSRERGEARRKANQFSLGVLLIIATAKESKRYSPLWRLRPLPQAENSVSREIDSAR
jgi:hypothetical protein